MRILLVTHQFAAPFSGVGTYSRALAQGLHRNGIETHILCPSSQCFDDDRFKFTKTREIPALSSHARWIFASRIFAESLNRIASYDVIHFLDARETLFLGKTAVPVVGTVHDYYFARPLRYWKSRSYFPDWVKRISYSCVVRLLEPRALHRCNHLISNSRATKKEISSAYGIPEYMMSTVYIGLDRTMEEQSISGKRNEHAVLFVGGNPYRKGLPRLLKAMATINHEIPAELWIVGLSLTRHLKRLVLSLDLETIVSVYPHLNQHKLTDLYSRASCLALPGLTEAFGLVFLEAFAHGCPVIGPSHGGSSEIITDGLNGFLVDPEMDGDLTEKLFRLLREPELTERFVAEGKKTLEAFKSEQMVQETINIYTGLLRGNL